MKFLACLLAVAVLCALFAEARPVDAKTVTLFRRFMRAHNKQYAKEEFSARLAIFEENLQRIDALNVQRSHATFGVTKFADLTPEEFKRMYLTLTVPKEGLTNLPVAAEVSESELQALPDNFDWRTHTPAVVTPVKDQGQCGSCWAFSTTGNTEGQHALKTGTLVSLSEQNLMDCSTSFGNQGCDGGLMSYAFEYIISNKGIDTEASYPYLGVDSSCAFNAKTVGATLTNWTMVSSDEAQMAAYLVANGPLSVAVDAEVWQFYLFGVLDAPCGTQLDHGVLIVGYGTEVDDFGFDIDFWIIKNSWSATWGESGYIRIQRGVGECGVNQFPCSGIA